MSTPIADRVIDLAVAIQQVPAPTFEEKLRAEYILSAFKTQGAREAFIDEAGNVYACIRGQGEQAPVIISAHLDTVFPLDTDLTISRTKLKIGGPGIGDNSLGLAGLFSLYWKLSGENREKNQNPHLPGDVWLVANTCEEGLGDLAGMRAVVNRFGSKPQAYIILEGMSLGQIYHRGLGVRRYRITVRTRGGHSWVDYGNPSAIHELAELAVKIKQLALPVEPRTSLNIGVISGGTSVNTIAAEASLQLDLRSVSPQALGMLAGQVENLAEQANRTIGGEDIKVDVQVIGDRPAGMIPKSHPLVRLAVDCLSRHGIKARLNIGSTDANVPLSQGLPAICVGLTHGGGSHTQGEFIELEPVETGLEVLSDLVKGVFTSK